MGARGSFSDGRNTPFNGFGNIGTSSGSGPGFSNNSNVASGRGSAACQEIGVIGDTGGAQAGGGGGGIGPIGGSSNGRSC